MAEAPAPYWQEDPKPTGNTFYGLSFPAFKALSHLDRLALMAKWDKKRKVRPEYRQSDDKLSNWTVLTTKKKKA